MSEQKTKRLIVYMEKTDYARMLSSLRHADSADYFQIPITKGVPHVCSHGHKIPNVKLEIKITEVK